VTSGAALGETRNVVAVERLQGSNGGGLKGAVCARIFCMHRGGDEYVAEPMSCQKRATCVWSCVRLEPVFRPSDFTRYSRVPIQRSSMVVCRGAKMVGALQGEGFDGTQVEEAGTIVGTYLPGR